jgi:hypothetical protein
MPLDPRAPIKGSAISGGIFNLTCRPPVIASIRLVDDAMWEAGPPKQAFSRSHARHNSRHVFFVNFLKNGSSSGMYCLDSARRTKLTPSRRVHHGSI